MAAPTVVRLHAPGRLGWLVLLALGIGMAWRGGAAFLGAPEPPPMAVALFGIGLAALGAALAVLLHRERPSELHVAPGELVIAAGTERVRVPLAAGELVVEDSQPPGKRVLALRRRDGLVEIGRVYERHVPEVIGAVRGEPEAGDTDPLAAVRDVRGLSAVRDHGHVELRWSTSMPASAYLAALPFAGAALGVYGLHMAVRGFILLLLVALLVLLALASLAAAVRSIGTAHHLVVDDERLSVERRRGERRIDTRDVPVADVAAVDHRAELHVFDPALLVRRAAGAAPPLVLPLGTLSRAARIGLALALGDELARRRARAPDPG
jgi:hypothetical protein